jgi:hypothetical protein
VYRSKRSLILGALSRTYASSSAASTCVAASRLKLSRKGALLTTFSRPEESSSYGTRIADALAWKDAGAATHPSCFTLEPSQLARITGRPIDRQQTSSLPGVHVRCVFAFCGDTRAFLPHALEKLPLFPGLAPVLTPLVDLEREDDPQRDDCKFYENAHPVAITKVSDKMARARQFARGAPCIFIGVAD